MEYEIPDFLLAAPEIFMLTMVCVILIVDLFLPDHRRVWTYVLAQATLVVPTTLTVTSTFAPRFTVGDPKTATITPTVTTASTYLQSFSAFSDWVSKVNSTLTSAAPAVQMTASGIYDRASNTFTATSIDLVL